MRRVLPMIATLAVMGVSALANTRTLNGLRTGQISDRLPTGFTPAGWVFSIWSVIYLGLLAYAGSQLWGGEALKARGDRVRVAYLVTAAANIGWILAWHHFMVGTSLALMLTLFAALIVAVRELRRDPPKSRAERWLVDAPFSLYAGWITTATFANVGALLSSTKGYPFGLGMDAWALGSVVVAAVIYVAVALRTRDAIYAAVWVWAALGIAKKPAGVTGAVQLAATLTGAVVLALIVGIVVRGRARPASA